MPEFRTHECLESELASFEAKLQKDGFMLAHKTDSKELNPMEYLKYQHSGSEHSFHGVPKWLTTWRTH